MPLSPVSTYVHASFAKFILVLDFALYTLYLVSSNKLDWIGNTTAEVVKE